MRNACAAIVLQCLREKATFKGRFIMKRRNVVSSMRTISVCVATLSFALAMAASTSIADAKNDNGAIVLKEQGTFYVEAPSSSAAQIVHQR